MDDKRHLGAVLSGKMSITSALVAKQTRIKTSANLNPNCGFGDFKATITIDNDTMADILQLMTISQSKVFELLRRDRIKS